jgi:cytochrome c biogenesis protein CcmG/thiol:disulfide interchange protein DsbE
MKNRFLWLFFAFVLFIALLAAGLRLDPSQVPSPLIGRNAPDFSLPRLDDGQIFSLKEMQGQIWLLNIWASWCVSCRAEHSLLVDLSRQKLLPIVGLNHKEVRGDSSIDADKLSLDDEIALAVERARNWLINYGNPYVVSVLDLSGQTGIDYGVYGVPESYLIDRDGIIRHKHIGPLTKEALNDKILPLAQQLISEARQ